MKLSKMLLEKSIERLSQMNPAEFFNTRVAELTKLYKVYLAAHDMAEALNDMLYNENCDATAAQSVLEKWEAL